MNKDRVIEYSNEIPVFLQDLNANVIIESITDDWGEEASNMFLKLPESKETEDYRRWRFKKCIILWWLSRKPSGNLPFGRGHENRRCNKETQGHTLRV